MCTYNVDAVAEREAAAIESLADLLGEPVPFTRLQLARLHAIEAAERGLPRPRKWQYRRLEAVKAWIAICRRIAAGDLATRQVVLVTADDQRRQEQRRQERLGRLQELRRMAKKSPPVDLPTAVRLSGLAERTLFKAMRSGELPAFHMGQRTYVRPADLRRCLDRRLSPRVNGRMPPVARQQQAAMAS